MQLGVTRDALERVDDVLEEMPARNLVPRPRNERASMEVLLSKECVLPAIRPVGGMQAVEDDVDELWRKAAHDAQGALDPNVEIYSLWAVSFIGVLWYPGDVRDGAPNELGYRNTASSTRLGTAW